MTKDEMMQYADKIRSETNARIAAAEKATDSATRHRVERVLEEIESRLRLIASEADREARDAWEAYDRAIASINTHQATITDLISAHKTQATEILRLNAELAVHRKLVDQLRDELDGKTVATFGGGAP